MTIKNYNSNELSLSKNISFGITHAKNLTDTHKSGSIQGRFKSFQKTAAYVHCFNTKTHH